MGAFALTPIPFSGIPVNLITHKIYKCIVRFKTTTPTFKFKFNYSDNAGKLVETIIIIVGVYKQ